MKSNCYRGKVPEYCYAVDAWKDGKLYGEIVFSRDAARKLKKKLKQKYDQICVFRVHIFDFKFEDTWYHP